MTSIYMTVPEIAEKWRVHEASVYRQIASGTLPALHIGTTKRVLISDVRAFEAAHSTGKKAS